MADNYRFRILNLLIILAAIFQFSCQCDKIQKVNGIPSTVIERSQSIFISKMTAEGFNKYIKYSIDRSQFNGRFYEIVYLFHPNVAGADTIPITLSMDTLNNVLYPDVLKEIPDLVSTAYKGEFAVAQKDARHIAELEHFPAGIKDWDIRFIYEPQLNKYVWSVITTFEQSAGSNGMRGKGKIMILDPVDGSVLKINDWNIR
jgi:hypothetical protein